MDTSICTLSPVSPINTKLEQSPPIQDKISAYYSLVFPHFTFYIQTLSVTIGRRCASNPNTATSSTAETVTVDVDLGALKSVSRLHAKIEYDQDEDRFVLLVIGRNGAWVDGVWSGSGTRAPLGERSQIQIASRIFHFVLPPPPPPEDTPSPSSHSSVNRPRSPSLDITSISPPSSHPSHTPPPSKLEPPSPLPRLESLPLHLKSSPTIPPHSQLPNSNSIGKSKKVISKKRKKDNVQLGDHPKPKPEDMPPKPPFTYAQLIYRAIKAIGEKATLHEICTWIMKTHKYYLYSDATWMSSVRHNLSSSRAFLKLERCGGDRGKGFFWTLDQKYSKVLEEQEARSSAIQSGNEGNGRRKKDKNHTLEPALKRSVKGDLKGGPLPPPLTSTPLVMKSTSLSTTVPPLVNSGTLPIPGKSADRSAMPGIFAYPALPQYTHVKTIPQLSTSSKAHSGSPLTTPNPYTSWRVHPTPVTNETSAPHTTTLASSPTFNASTSSAGPTSSQTPQSASSPSIPDVNLPIVLGPIPTTHPDYSPSHPNNSAKEGYMILHERTLILDPDVFGGLTRETLTGLEEMGTIAALQVLKTHMVKALKERRARGRGRTREKGSKRIRGFGKKGENAPTDTGGPFTNVPLESRKPTKAVNHVDAGTNKSQDPVNPPVADTTVAPIPVSTHTGQGDGGSPIVIIDDSDDDGPAAKRRKVDDICC